MKAFEDILCKVGRGDLADTFENDVANIVETDGKETRARIGKDETGREQQQRLAGGVIRAGHRVDRVFHRQRRGEDHTLCQQTPSPARR